MTSRPIYLHLHPDEALPENPCEAPFRALVVLEDSCTTEWRERVCRWLVGRGCLYAMTWGKDSSDWDTAIDIANTEKYEFKEIPENGFVMTTWHDSEPLSETMWFAKNNACHPTVELQSTLLVHLARNPSEARLLSAYAEA